MKPLPLFFVPLLVGACIQVIKITIDVIIEQRFHRSALFVSGGFPSTHGGITASITTLMALYYGFYSAEFAISFSFSFLFRYDAINIRYEAGQHASYINKISAELQEIFVNNGKTILLKERLGHTFVEIIGGIVTGASMTLLYYFLIGNTEYISAL